ncbi:MAG: glycosyltransferase family 2 protein [Elusimicrobiota bacterium]
MRLSVIIITRDEEADLPECLDSVRPLGAEIVVLDDASTDKTLEIARGRGCSVTAHPFKDYASQKQAALERASGEWVLSIDADERVTPGLAKEVLEVLASEPEPRAFEVPFEVVFMGRTLRFGGLGGEHHVRLFRRDSARFVGGLVHEGVEVRGPVGWLRSSIRHIPYRDLDEYLAKMSVYTSNAARKRRAQGRRFHAWHHLLPFWEFLQRAVLRGGLLDGTPGIVYAGLSSFHTWLKYLKLRELDRGSDG